MVYARHGACSQGELRAHGLDAELRPWLEVETGRRKKTMERVRAGLRLDGHPMRRSQCHGRRPPPPGHRPHRQRAAGNARGLQDSRSSRCATMRGMDARRRRVGGGSDAAGAGRARQSGAEEGQSGMGWVGRLG